MMNKDPIVLVLDTYIIKQRVRGIYLWKDILTTVNF